MEASIGQRVTDPLNSSFDDKAQWVILAVGQPAGWVSISVVSRSHAVANAGYTIAEQFRGDRLAGPGLRLAGDIAFDRDALAIDRIEANCTVTNIASVRTLEYAGFTQEGIARGYLVIRGRREDHLRYGRLVEDPSPTP